MAAVKTPLRLAIGALTVFPLVAIFGIAFYAAYALITNELATHGALRDPVSALIDMDKELWAIIVIGAFFIAIYELVLGFAFIIHAATRSYMSVGAKIAWSAALFLIGFVAAPLYWLVHLARAAPRPLAGSFTGV